MVGPITTRRVAEFAAGLRRRKLKLPARLLAREHDVATCGLGTVLFVHRAGGRAAIAPKWCRQSAWCRGCAWRAAAARAKRIQVGIERLGDSAHFVTGTLPAGGDVERQRVRITRAWDRYVRKVRRGLGHCGDTACAWVHGRPVAARYLAVFETGKRDEHWHVHALLEGTEGTCYRAHRHAWGVSVAEVWEDEAWPEGAGSWDDPSVMWFGVRPYGEPARRAWYLAKYLTKVARDGSGEVVAAWYRRRRLTASRGILPPEETGDWMPALGGDRLARARELVRAGQVDDWRRTPTAD